MAKRSGCPGADKTESSHRASLSIISCHTKHTNNNIAFSGFKNLISRFPSISEF